METWMIIQGLGGLLGLGSLAGIIWAFKKVEAPKKFFAMATFAVIGAVAGYFAANATAVTTTEEEAAIEEQIDDFDAPLDDDF